MIKAVFFDIDGTLVSFNTHQVPQSTQDAIALLKKKGIKTFIATGRQYEAINNLGDLQFDGYITLNGSYCFIENEEVIYKTVIPKEDMQALIHYLNHVKSFPCIFVTEHTFFGNYLNDDAYFILDQLNFPIPELLPVEKALEEDIYQVISFFKREDEQDILSHLPHCDIARWSPLFTDLIPKGSSKQVGIDQVLKHFDISLEDTMAFGDGGNDIPMLRHIPCSIAMGNAEEEVKESAAYVTTSVDDDGVWKALKHFQVI